MDRVCQFYLRGRCNRSNCEFKHVKPVVEGGGVSGSRKAPCRFYEATGNCRFGENCRFNHDKSWIGMEKGGNGSVKKRSEMVDSDEDLAHFPPGMDSDEESIVSGFTDSASIVVREGKRGEELKEELKEEALHKAAGQEEGSRHGGEPLSLECVDACSGSIGPPQKRLVHSLDRGPYCVASGEKKQSLMDLRKDWSDEEEECEEDQTAPSAQVETLEDSQLHKPMGEDTVKKLDDLSSSVNEKSKKLHTKSKEEWVTLIFGEDGKPSEESRSKIYDLNPADSEMDKDKELPTLTSRRRGGAKVRGGLRGGLRMKKEGVTKIGNNMYFYTGAEDTRCRNNGNGQGEEQNEDNLIHVDESTDWIGSTEDGVSLDKSYTLISEKPKRRTKKHKPHRTDYVYAGKSTAAKTRRCGECENCNKEDCNKCDACRDKPRNGGKGLKKQACIYRVCLWKNPSGKTANVASGRSRGRPKTKPPPGLIKTESLSLIRSEENQECIPGNNDDDDRKKSGRLSLPVIAPGVASKQKTESQPDDADLPEFDPDKFRPGYTPSIVKKGDAEYVVVVTGVKDTGLCGKYWSDIDNLPSRRRGRVNDDQNQSKKITDDNSIITPSKKISSRKGFAAHEEIKRNKNQDLSIASKRKLFLKSEVKKNIDNEFPSVKKSKVEASLKQNKHDTSEDTLHHLKNDKSPSESLLKSRSLVPSVSQTSYDSHTEDDSQVCIISRKLESTSSHHIRSVSCVADTSTQREVVVECFAPYDDHRWVNIGKERDNMTPDSVQYARALRPPYHLLSFLRIKGNSTKGMSCTDKNTMVFVVLEGEISVVLHTTQFNAKKGDSFYIPPKNYYNLINQKVREAELSLIQFQYDGPLPTVAASSQSGSARTST
ncbi:uncharacterized protein [Lepeophtheirus salmonis]|nr:uncharacterized protein LOC121127324 isoform X2 [Lepeophtheirus salmonis]